MSPCPGSSCCLGAQTDINKKGPVLEYFEGPIVAIRLKLYFAIGKMSFNPGSFLSSFGQCKNLAPVSLVKFFPYIFDFRGLCIMKCPAEAYQPSVRAYQGLDYGFRDSVIVVTNCRHTCVGHKKINFCTVLVDQAVGIKEIHDDIWLSSFMDYDLRYLDLETCVLEPLDNPFGRKLLSM
jgi:hypothetical protein